MAPGNCGMLQDHLAFGGSSNAEDAGRKRNFDGGLKPIQQEDVAHSKPRAEEDDDFRPVIADFR